MKKKSKYTVKLETVGLTYEGKGEDVLECLQNIGLSWNEIKAKGLLKAYKNKKKFEKLFAPKVLKAIFGNKLVMKVWANRLEYLLKTV